ncbi:MAG: 2-oxoglutarate dehydrogenase, E2 component, dihydrolipoamide succinyltransferase [Micrococcales bacterium]|nr:2-oxoglutarate dehydrogenase, E2 component, dihydrolipoamide succinyltransferase [Micrococcales bacterium]NBR54618.1 2-oxoglutarate dehydrogenase, E2 component, dihydrolipoamide succinyltransferase [Micrococcales bacterium]NBR61312.1 2-oxoglutarate dehydrogenase, E2 component, dihydrolipoamide succinyltransferase [Actinomycetota bacterium]NBT47006.1 2-oxoglutarate dehydrogenase, E2 component, dihydrolipoamide succinyltransferase [Actinomycetota bacterium]NBY43802.1 2-oxoglutarate dehydrogena
MSEVKLPALGESVTEGTITRWLKKVGDSVAIDEPLVEVSTDKVDTEIPSPVAGTLQQILVQEDETAAVGAVLAIVADGVSATASTPTPDPIAEPVAAPVVSEAPVVMTPVVTSAPTAPATEPIAQAPLNLPVFTPQVNSPAPVPAAPQTVPQTSNEPAYVTPLVRKMAAEAGVDLSSVSGTGVGGRIRREDVLSANTTSATIAPAVAHTPAAASNLRGTSEPMSRLRKVLAERAVASMVSTAQLTTVVEVDITKIAQLRSKVQTEFTAKTGVKLNFMPFFFLAAAEALRSHPKINASIDGENIVYHPSENISFAVDTERGLLTPVIRDAASLSLGTIAQQIADLAARTRENKLKPDELSGGTFTLTNTGSRGALFDTPVVFLPQSAILGTGVVTKRPVVVTDENGQDSIAIRSMVYLALSYDHRLIDGADASRFLVDVKTRLEEANFSGNMGF